MADRTDPSAPGDSELILVNLDHEGLALQGYDPVAYSTEGKPVCAYGNRWERVARNSRVTSGAPRPATEEQDREEGQRAEASAAASVAKAHLCQTFHLVSNESIQMHGGIGMTDGHEIGFYLKRARVLAQTFGDETIHAARFAELSGY